MNRRLVLKAAFGGIVLGVVLAAAALLPRAQSGPPAASSPGPLADGTTLLPNGWRLAPAGRHLAVGDLPLNLVQSPDGRSLIVTNNGVAKPSFSVIDVASWTVKSTTTLDHAWYGLAWHPDGTKLYSAGGNQNNVQEFTFADGTLTRARTFTLPDHSANPFVGGIAVSRDGRMLYVTRVFAMTLSAIDLVSGQVVKTVSLPAEPYTPVVSADGSTVYVSLWGGSDVQVFTSSLTPVDDLLVDEHPNAMVLSADGRRLFVACASASSVWVYDTFSRQPIEQISMSLFPNAPPTSTPNALALSPDGQTLLAVNADTNTMAVVDVGNAGRSFVNGFVPTGWYPTGALFSRDGKQVFVLSGKGVAPPTGRASGGMASRLLGALSAVATPDRTALAEYTRKVYTLTPYTDAIRLSPANAPVGSPIPRTVGASSPIKHVFYVIRENRTYDQILGDLTQGNGDPKLTLFGNDVTPNAHAIAQNFVLLDNFYVDADVSYDGHAFSTAAYATDFIMKMWQTYSAGRGAPFMSEGGGLLRNPFGNVSAPPQGYLWDNARRSRVTVRSYGEFVSNTSRSASGDVVAVEAVPGLKGVVAPAYAGFDLDITDQKRVDVWLQEFAGFVANGNLPQLSIIRIGNDHTQGTKPGAPTPRAMVADNDVALGRIVEAVSNSVYWKDSAIIAVEDDAQAGADHVDSHRSVLLVASPFAKHAAVDHTFYTTSGVLRTIELVLGLEPLSQYDSAAMPLYNAFQSTPNLQTFRRSDAHVPLDEKNSASAFGAAQSLSLDFSDADRTPEALLNEIVWGSVRGASSPMPPARRSIFVGSSGSIGDDDDR